MPSPLHSGGGERPRRREEERPTPPAPRVPAAGELPRLDNRGLATGALARRRGRALVGIAPATPQRARTGQVECHAGRVKRPAMSSRGSGTQSCTQGAGETRVGPIPTIASLGSYRHHF